MIDLISDVLKDVLLALLWWILLFPIVLLAATPFIVIASLLGPPKYFAARVGKGYHRVIDFWSNWGIVLTP